MQLIKITKHLLHLQVVRYFISAGSATLIDTGTFYVTLNPILHSQDIVFHNFTFAATHVAFAAGSALGLVSNFVITKYFVFNESNIKGHVQFFRYVGVALLVILANYGMLTQILLNKGLMHQFSLDFIPKYPTIDRGFTAVVIGLLSFSIHKVFSFQIRDTDET